MAYRRQIRSRAVRGRVIRAMAANTKGGKGRIKNRASYKKGMSKKPSGIIESLTFLN